MEIINKFRAKASKASTAQSMLRALEKVERIEIVPPPPKIKLTFKHLKQPGKIVLKVIGVAHVFDHREIFKNISFELFRGDKAAIVASNGVGKTTLINIITGKLRKQKGIIDLGHNVSITVFEQDQEAILDRSKTIYEEVESICTTPEMRLQIRHLLGAFLFSGDDIDKKIAVLSGGEKNRVAMVKVLLQHANVLILDEPTNHLDIESKDILLKALKQFPGTILFVSHDHTFLNGLATRIFELSPTGIVSYTGNFESYHYQKSQEAAQSLFEPPSPSLHSWLRRPETAAEPALSLSKGTYSGRPGLMNDSLSRKQVAQKFSPHVPNRRLLYELKKKIASIERKIDSLEKDQLDLAQKLELLDYGTSEFTKTYDQLEQVKENLSQAMIQWEELNKELKKCSS
jgi:ATP-binding cassette subfamily F protein 3